MGQYSEKLKQLQDELVAKRELLEKKNADILNSINVEVDKYNIMNQVDNYEGLLKDYLYNTIDSSDLTITYNKKMLVYSFELSVNELDLLTNFHKQLYDKLGLEKPKK